MTPRIPSLPLALTTLLACIGVAVGPAAAQAQPASAASAASAAAPAPRPLQMPTDGCLQPPYPAPARRSGAEGRTRVLLTIEPEGSVSKVVVLRRSGNTKEHQLMDEAAVQSVGRCHFGAAEGYPPLRAQMDVVWRLEPDPFALRPPAQPAPSAPPAAPPK